MKAALINGKIEVFSKIPTDKPINGKYFAGGNYSDELLKENGIYDLIYPNYDERVQELVNLHLDGDIYTYDVIDKTFTETLAELKSHKIDHLKSLVGNKLSLTDWYIIRESDSGEPTPQSIKDERANLRTQSDNIEAEINALTTKKSVILFDINI